MLSNLLEAIPWHYFIPNKTFNVKNACISLHAVACCCMLLHATSGLVLFECTVRHDGWFPPQFFRTDLLVREGERKSKAVPSSGTCEVGPVSLTNSSTWTGELSIVHCRYPLRFPSHWCSRFCFQKLKYQIHHLIAFAKLLLFLLL